MAIRKNSELEEIVERASFLKREGIDAHTLEIAEEIYQEILKVAQSFFGLIHDHIGSESIAIYLKLFGTNLKGKKVLDLGCGMDANHIKGLLSYAPILSIFLKSLGAEVYAVDVVNDYEGIMSELGINYVKGNLLNFSTFSKNPSFFRMNDIIILRSFLHGGLLKDESLNPLTLNDKEEYKHFLEILERASYFNNKKAIYELDNPYILKIIEKLEHNSLVDDQQTSRDILNSIKKIEQQAKGDSLKLRENLQQYATKMQMSDFYSFTEVKRKRMIGQEIKNSSYINQFEKEVGGKLIYGINSTCRNAFVLI